MRSTHRCKLHDHRHFYERCEKCEHDYCARYWYACPRCHAVIARDGFWNRETADPITREEQE